MLREKLEEAVQDYCYMKGFDYEKDELYHSSYYDQVTVGDDTFECYVTVGKSLELVINPNGNEENSYPVLHMEKDAFGDEFLYILKNGYGFDDVLNTIRDVLKDYAIDELQEMGKYEFIHYCDQVAMIRYIDSMMF